jgi:hypothetical protein
VRWTKTRWRCRQDYCERSSFTEAVAQIGVDLAAERIWVFSLILSGSGCGAQGAVAFAAEFGFDIERVGAVKVDVVVLRRGPSAAGP